MIDAALIASQGDIVILLALFRFMCMCASMLKQIAATVQEVVGSCTWERLGARTVWTGGAVAAILSKIVLIPRH